MIQYTGGTVDADAEEELDEDEEELDDEPAQQAAPPDAGINVRSSPPAVAVYGPPPRKDGGR